MKKRILIKLSGETLTSRKSYARKDLELLSKDELTDIILGNNWGNYDEARCQKTAEVLAELTRMDIEPGVVIGGGNIWRGRFSKDIDAVNADQMGMLATILNALCMQDFLTRLGVRAEVFTAQEMNRFAELYTARAADKCLHEGGIALCAGGSGNPFFTTDTAVVLRAAELHADCIYKGTNVNGIYDRDPKQEGAVFYKDITYTQCIEQGLKVMDQSAFLMMRERAIPEVRVFNMDDVENILRVARGEDVGTTVHD